MLKNMELLYSMSIPIRASKIKCITYIILKILLAFIPGVQILVITYIINYITSDTSSVDFDKQFYMSFIILVVVVGYKWIMQNIEMPLRELIRNDIDNYNNLLFLKKRSNLKYSYIDNNELNNLVSRVCDDGSEQISSAFFAAIGFIELLTQSIIYFIILTIYISWGAFVLLVAAIPLLIISHKFGEANYNLTKETTLINRWQKYYKKVLLNREFAEEKELYNYSDKIKKLWKDSYENCRRRISRTEAKWYAKIKIGSIFTEVVTFLIIGIVLTYFEKKFLSIGFVLAFITATLNFVSLISWNLPYYIKDLSSSTEYFKEYKKFLDMEEEISGEISITELNNIEFKKVSFTYPNSKKMILDHLSLKIEKGKHYALVGLNGEGKTTIIKILLGLYDDYTGEIYINKISLKKINKISLRKKILLMQQDFAKYNISLRDNILLGKEKNIETALKYLNLNNLINSLPNGLNTKLGRLEVGSSDLSGGEWQKVAFARILLKDGDFYMFDEPTASLDPLAELELNREILRIFKEKTTLIISHRFSLVKEVDEILVIHKGKIKEKGKHNELLNKKGLYAQMYESQREWYI